MLYRKAAAKERENMEHIWIKPLRNTEINVIQYGEEACLPRHAFGPAVRDHFLLHFIASGHGRFSSGGREYSLGAGEGFLIRPHEVAYYEADEEEPWHYFWIGFSGGGKVLEECGLSEATPVFSFADVGELEKTFRDMETADETQAEGQLKLTGHLFMLLSSVRTEAGAPSVPARDGGTKRDYVENAIRYIQQNYPLKLTVSGIADRLGIHRSYFAAIFREHTRMSPQEFIFWVRMTRAEELLKDGRLAVAGVARSVGYEDALLFSKAFKKYTGLSPRAYRDAEREG